MNIHPSVTHLNGIVTVALAAQFTGALTDADDRARISSYGDPLVNLGGSFSDGDPTPFTLVTGSTEVWVPLTTRMQDRAIRFMTQLPAGEGVVGPLDVITSDPVKAAGVYVPAIQARIAGIMASLRAKTPAKLATLSDSTV